MTLSPGTDSCDKSGEPDYQGLLLSRNLSLSPLGRTGEKPQRSSTAIEAGLPGVVSAITEDAQSWARADAHSRHCHRLLRK